MSLTFEIIQCTVVILQMHGHLSEEHDLTLFNYNDDLFKDEFYDKTERLDGSNLSNDKYKKERGE